MNYFTRQGDSKSPIAIGLFGLSFCILKFVKYIQRIDIKSRIAPADPVAAMFVKLQGIF